MSDDKSYKRYRKYRENRYQYEMDQIAIPVGAIILLTLFFQYWKAIVTVLAVALGLIVYRKVRRKRIMKSTTAGFVNKNEQRNIGCTFEQGTDNNQMFYAMECLNCGHCYKANGSDIWQRKCPKCQGGKP
jgi:hypothetical protein